MSTKTFVEYALLDTGAVSRRTITEQVLDVSSDIMEKFAKKSVRKLANFVVLPEWGPVHLAITESTSCFSLDIATLPIKAPWRLVGEVMVPIFNSKTDPIMTMLWTPPADMKLKCVVRVMPHTQRETPIAFAGQWVFAMDHRGNAYRIPISNLHDDCSVCTGMRQPYYTSAMEALLVTLDTYKSSQYNADLWKSIDLTHAMFRMKPVGKTFEAMAPERHWTELCIKVSNTITEVIL